MPDPTTQPPPPQPVTQSILDEAKRSPNTWIFAIDAAYRPVDLADPVPPQAIVGAWESDANGQIAGDFRPNPHPPPPSHPALPPRPAPRRLRPTDYLILAFVLLVTLGFLTSLLLLPLFSHPSP